MAWINPNLVNCPQENHTSKKAYLRFTVTDIRQTDGGANQTTIDWKLTIEGTAWCNLHARYLSVGGKELVPLNTSTVTKWSVGQVINSGSTTFDNNADGSLALNVFVKQLFYYTYSDARWNNSSYSQSGSGTLTCSTIARYPVLSYNTVSTTINTMTCGLSNARAGNMTEFQVARTSDGGVIKHEACNGSFSFTIGGLAPNTDYSGHFKVRALANGGWGDWLILHSNYDTTAPLPTINATAYVGIEDNTTIQFNNLNHISSWEFAASAYNGSSWVTIASRTNITTNNYLFKLTESEKTELLKLFKGTTPPYIHVVAYVYSNGTKYDVHNSSGNNPQVNYSIPDNSTYQPTFGADKVTSIIDTLNTAITGSNTKFIKNHNKLQGTIAPMGLKYSATGKGYTITVGTKSTSLNYTTSNQNFTINNVDGNSVKIVASDSRGKTTTVSKTITLIDYANPTIGETQAVRQNGIDNYAIIKASGKYTNWSGLSKANTISKVEYRWKLATAGDNTYSAWKTITGVAVSNGSWSIEKLLDDVFSNTERYYIQIRITDLLETITSQPFILSTANVFLWKDVKNKRLGINKKPTTALDVNGDVNVDGVITSHNRVQVANEVAANKVVAPEVNVTDRVVATNVETANLSATGSVTVGGSLTIDHKIVAGNVPIASGLQNVSFDDVGGGEVFNKSGLHTMMTTGGTWYNLINVRHRNGTADGTNYGMQIRMPFNTFGNLEGRFQHAGNWSGWEHIQRSFTIFENSSGVTSATTSLDASHLKYMEIFYSHNAPGYGYKSVRIEKPNNKRATLDLTEGQGAYTVMYSGHILINGTSVAFTGGSGISIHSSFALGGYAGNNEIKIHKIVGYL